MTTTTPAGYVAHTAGPMILGVQRCLYCRVVLADETPFLDSRVVRAGSLRYLRGGLVLLLEQDDAVVIRGPIRRDQPLPRGTRTCTPPPRRSEGTHP